MGILDSLTKQVMGTSGTQDLLLGALMNVLGNQQAGGLAGIVKQFSGKGLGNLVESWVGTGANLPVTPEQVERGLGKDTIAQIAKQAGIPTGDVTSQLVALLPQVIDKLTPGGKMPEGDLMGQGLSMLKGLMK